MKKPTTKKSYTISEAAKKLGITRAAIHDAIRKGRLEAEWGEIIVKGRLITADALKAYRKRLSLSHQERGKKT